MKKSLIVLIVPIVPVLVALVACSEGSPSNKALPVSPLEATKPPPPPVTPPTPAAPAPGTPVASPTPPPAPVAQPSLATCVKFPPGITVIESEAALAKLAREEGPMAAGCPETLPPSGINFETLSLVLAFTTATCNGEITPSATGFTWSEWGDCERAQILKSSNLVSKANAKAQKLTKAEKL